MHLALDRIVAGYRPVVFNQRGNRRIKLKVILSINHFNSRLFFKANEHRKRVEELLISLYFS